MRTSYEILTRLGESYISVGNYSKAKYCFEKAALLFPEHPEPHVGLGTVAMREQNFDDSEASFQFALKLSDDCASAYRGLGSVYYQRGSFEQAFEMYLKALELNSNSVSALLGLFQTSRKVGDFTKIRFYLEVYLENHPNDTQILYCMAALYIEHSDFVDAKNALNRILKIDPDHSDAAELLEEVEKKLLRH